MSEERTVVIGAGRFEPGSNEFRFWNNKNRGGNGYEDTRAAAKVLIHTIRKNGFEGKIINTYDMQRPRLLIHRNPTPFSLVRFWVPELCGFEGRAAYLDADMIVFADMNDLFDRCTGDYALWSCRRESVIVYDCARLKHWNVWEWRDQLDSGKLDYKTFMVGMAGEKPVGVGPEEWNDLDKYRPGITKLLHYTLLTTQPWRPTSKHPHAMLWWDALRDAAEAGYVTKQDLEFACLNPAFLSKINIPEDDAAVAS